MDIINFIINMLYNLDIFWDIDRQKMHRNNKLRKKNQSIYYFGKMKRI